MNTLIFSCAFNQNLINLTAVQKIKSQAEYMMLSPVTKVTCGTVRITVECDTPKEKKILENLYNELYKTAV